MRSASPCDDEWKVKSDLYRSYSLSPELPDNDLCSVVSSTDGLSITATDSLQELSGSAEAVSAQEERR